MLKETSCFSIAWVVGAEVLLPPPLLLLFVQPPRHKAKYGSKNSIFFITFYLLSNNIILNKVSGFHRYELGLFFEPLVLSIMESLQRKIRLLFPRVISGLSIFSGVSSMLWCTSFLIPTRFSQRPLIEVIFQLLLSAARWSYRNIAS